MRFFVYLSLIAALLVSFVPAHAQETAAVVDPANMQGWQFGQEKGIGGGWGDFVKGPATAPLGEGSAHLVLNDSTVDWTFGKVLQAGPKLADLTRLEYSTYINANETSQAISLQLAVDFDITDDVTLFQGRLIYEPYINDPGLLTGEWRTWNTITDHAKWYATRYPYQSVCSVDRPCTWSDIKTKYPNAAIHPTGGKVLFKAGSGWNTFDGNVDKLVIGVGTTVETFDFEPPSTVYVDDDWASVPYNTDPDGKEGPAYRMGIDSVTTINDGLAKVTSSGTIKVRAGSYQEQVVIQDRDGLSIDGAGEAATTIVSPELLTALVSDRKPVVGVKDSENVTIKNLKVDGAGTGNSNNRLHGVLYYNSSGVIDHLKVIGVRHTPLDNTPGGVAVIAINDDNADRTVTASNNILVDYQKGGFAFSGKGLTVNIKDNTVTGAGAFDVTSQNGIQISGQANALIEGNTVTGHHYTGPLNWSSAGILTIGGVIEIRENTISNNQIGIAPVGSKNIIVSNEIADNNWGILAGGGASEIYANAVINNTIVGIDIYTYGPTEPVSAVIMHNRIFGNAAGVANEIATVDGQTATAIDATDNWWGCNDGPKGADCDGVYADGGPVTADTWLVLTLTSDQTHVIDGRPANLAATLTINSAESDVSSSAIAFPDGYMVNFETTAATGALTNASDVLEHGTAESVLSVAKEENLGESTVSVILDNETVTLDLLTGTVKYWLPFLTTVPR